MRGFKCAVLTFFATAVAFKADKFEYERLDKNDTALLIIDIQDGLFQLVRDFDAGIYKNAAIAHAALGKAFDLPVVMTTSAEDGPNGPMMEEILDLYPKAPLIRRHGEINAWDNEEFRDAVRSTNKSQVIVAGIVTDVCTAFAALSLRAEGYSVWANAEASGTTTQLSREITNDRLAKAGVNVVTFFALVSDLMRDWRNTPGAKEIYPLLNTYFPIFGPLARAHDHAIENGTLTPLADN